MIQSNRYFEGDVFDQLNKSGQSIHNVTFESCDFTGCDFSSVQFKQCRFIECQFTRCNLALVDFSGSEFDDVTFEQCKLLGINWTTVNWPQFMQASPVAFNACLLNNSSFAYLVLPQLVLTDSQVKECDFQEGQFQQANFSGSELQLTRFHHTDLTKANFTQATGVELDIHNNTLTGAKLELQAAISILSMMDIDVIV